MEEQKKDSFVFYRSFYEAISDLPDEIQIKIYKAICKIGLDQEEVELTGIANTILKLIKPQLEANNKRFTNGCKGKEYGKLGGRPKKPQENPKETPTRNPNEKPQENPKETPNVNVNDNDNVNDNENNNSSFLEKAQEEFINITSLQYEILQELENTYGEEKCMMALKECSMNNKKSISYLKGILKNWKDKTITEIKTNKKESNKPEWLDKKIEPEEMTEQELKELEEMYKNFN